ILRGASCPVSKMGSPRALIFSMIAASAALVPSGGIPCSASLPPSSMMTALASSGSAQSRRFNAATAVSPETPALTTVTSVPCALSAASSCAGKASFCGKPSPAVRLSPNATITGARGSALIVCSGASRRPTAKMTMREARFIFSTSLPFSIADPRAICQSLFAPPMEQVLKQRQPAAIKLEELHVTLPSRAGPVAILRGIDLSVTPSDAIAVVGPSGSGKSTLLMVVAGLERATEGRVSVQGTDYARLDEDGLARLRAANIGIVFQSFHLVPTMTALENVALPLEFLDHDDAFGEARAALAEVGLSHRQSHFPGQLSGGEQQRVAIAG